MAGRSGRSGPESFSSSINRSSEGQASVKPRPAPRDPGLSAHRRAAGHGPRYSVQRVPYGLDVEADVATVRAMDAWPMVPPGECLDHIGGTIAGEGSLRRAVSAVPRSRHPRLLVGAPGIRSFLRQSSAGCSGSQPRQRHGYPGTFVGTRGRTGAARPEFVARIPACPRPTRNPPPGSPATRSIRCWFRSRSFASSGRW